MKILVVDDEESIRFTLEIFLLEEGYDVSLASNYDEAVSLIKETSFDLMFIDIILGGKSGIDLLRIVKDGNPNAQVIIITGAPSIDTATRALKLGALDYIIKPVRQKELIKLTRLSFLHKQIADEKDHCRASMETIFTSVSEGIITFDPTARIIDMNEPASRLCADHNGDFKGRPLADMSKNCSGACIDILQGVLVNKKNRKIEHIECARKDSPRQIVSISAAPLIDHMQIFTGCVMVLRDETRLHALEGNVRESLAFQKMIGNGQEITKLKQLIQELAKVPSTVLITGESGSGKELTVEALHSAGNRHNGPLVKVNCGALTDSILESELFGHVQGAFTGAIRDRVGRFHLAHKGTIFLDEIGDISPKMQLQLLRTIETMSFERVGSSTTEQVDVRIVTATNKNLAQKVAAGEFREDLYYRLKVVELKIPPLRARREDIPLLIHHNLQKFNRKFNKHIHNISSDVKRLFLSYSWPGNIREFENAIEHAFIFCDQKVIAFSHLPAELQDQANVIGQSQCIVEGDEAVEIQRALEKTNGNKAQAARLLSMSRRTIYRKINKYNLHD